MRHLNITITGKVQGVFFRDSTKAVADQLGVKGFVMNRPDGSVYTEAEGTDVALDLFIEWCGEGPERAEVQELFQEEGAWKGYRNFEVRKKQDLFS